MTISALFATALTLALGAGLPSAAPHSMTAPEPDIIVIDDLGIHNAPTQWFADAVLVPGDSAERTVLIQNGCPEATSVTVTLAHIESPTDRSFLDDLRLQWGASEASVAEINASAPILAEEVVLAPGERLPVTLGYVYGHEVTRPPAGVQALTFTISIDALDPSSATGGTPSDGALAVTGGVLAPWWIGGLLGTVLGWWLYALRRKRPEEGDEEPTSAEGSLQPAADGASPL